MDELESTVEAILFASGEPVEIGVIANALDKEIPAVRWIIDNLKNKYINEKRGIRVLEIEDSFQLSTNPDYFEYVEKIFKIPKRKALSQTILETLAIIAYRQPVTKAQIESIRGVNAEHAVNTLMKYNLVTEKGRLDAPGRPILFGTTDEFLKRFGFKGLIDLPDMKNIDTTDENE